MDERIQMWQVNESPIETNRLKRPVYRLSNQKVETLFGTPVLTGIKEAEQLSRVVLGPGVNFVSVVASNEALNSLSLLGWKVVEESVGKLRYPGEMVIPDHHPRLLEKFKAFEGKCYLPGQEIKDLENLISQMRGWSSSFTGSYHRCGCFEKEVVDAAYENWFFDILRATNSVRLLAFCPEGPLTAHTYTWSSGIWTCRFALTSPSKMTVGASSAAAYGKYPEWSKFFSENAILCYTAVNNYSSQALTDRLGFKTAHFRQILYKNGTN